MAYARTSTELAVTWPDLVGKKWIWVNCTNDKCGRGTKHDPSDIVDKVGIDYPIQRFLDRCRCERCGTRGATITLQPPHMPDGSDQPRNWR